MRLIPLNGKHAIGHFAHAKVDDSDYDRLIQWSWKAKPNGDGTLIYAVRNTRISGVHKTIRMHREVLGLPIGCSHDVDHIDHDTVNNCRSNLEKVSRSVNVQRRRLILLEGDCPQCGSEFFLTVEAGSRQKYCSNSCADAAYREKYLRGPIDAKSCEVCGSAFNPSRMSGKYCSKVCSDKAAHPPYSTVYFKQCKQCDQPYVTRRAHGKFCSKRCGRLSSHSKN